MATAHQGSGRRTGWCQLLGWHGSGGPYRNQSGSAAVNASRTAGVLVTSMIERAHQTATAWKAYDPEALQASAHIRDQVQAGYLGPVRSTHTCRADMLRTRTAGSHRHRQSTAALAGLDCGNKKADRLVPVSFFQLSPGEGFGFESSRKDLICRVCTMCTPQNGPFRAARNADRALPPRERGLPFRWQKWDKGRVRTDPRSE
jgi:hypothetical protein